MSLYLFCIRICVITNPFRSNLRVESKLYQIADWIDFIKHAVYACSVIALNVVVIISLHLTSVTVYVTVTIVTVIL